MTLKSGGLGCSTQGMLSVPQQYRIYTARYVNEPIRVQCVVIAREAAGMRPDGLLCIYACAVALPRTLIIVIFLPRAE